MVATSDRAFRRKGAIALGFAMMGALGAAWAMHPNLRGLTAFEISPRASDKLEITFSDRFLTPADIQTGPIATQAQLQQARAQLSQAMRSQVADSNESADFAPAIPLPRTRPLASKLMASLNPSMTETKQPTSDPLAEVSSALRKVFAMVQPGAVVLASASTDGGINNDGSDRPSGMVAPNQQAALYDISAHTVYMPDGTRLEAHSGFQELLDDVRHVDVKDRGATPPQVYELKLRERLFHGVQALRMTPVGEGELYGRTGLLAHNYMLGPNGDSNGCVSFKDYGAFLRAFQSGSIKRLVVVKTLSNETVAETGRS